MFLMHVEKHIVQADNQAMSQQGLLCIYEFIHIKHAHSHVHVMHTCVYIRMCNNMHEFTGANLSAPHAHIHIHVHMQVVVRMHICMHINTHMHIDIHMQLHPPTSSH